MKQPKLFTKVKCVAYLKKHNDGVHIELFNPDGSGCAEKYVTSYDSQAIAIRYDAKTGKNIEIADLSDFDGSCVEKVYRKRVEEEFAGVIVGYKSVKVVGLIGTAWRDDDYGAEHGYCFKEVKYAPKVAVVYFKNNCKRYVLLDDLLKEDE